MTGMVRISESAVQRLKVIAVLLSVASMEFMQISPAPGPRLFCPFEDVDACVLSSAFDVDVPAAFIVSFSIDGKDDALVAEAFGGFGNEFGTKDGGGVHGDFVSPGKEHFSEVFCRPHAASDGEGDGNFPGNGFDGLGEDGAVLVGGGDVVEDEFIGAASE